MAAPVITFLSDYGLSDHFVGLCHAVIVNICPQARIIDISHGVPRHDVRAGALMLQSAIPFVTPGVHLAVVDPDVGAERRAVALSLADGRLLVGPDNGLLALIAQRCGGIVEAVEIGHSWLRLEPVSATFHGRDIFAPVTAHLAAGVQLAEAGTPLDPAELTRLELPGARREDGVLVAHAIYIDRFGNVQLNVDHQDLTGTGMKLGYRVRLRCDGDEHEAQYARTFADVDAGQLLVYEDADRRLAVAVNHGSAAAQLQIELDGELRIRPT